MCSHDDIILDDDNDDNNEWGIDTHAIIPSRVIQKKRSILSEIARKCGLSILTFDTIPVHQTQNHEDEDKVVCHKVYRAMLGVRHESNLEALHRMMRYVGFVFDQTSIGYICPQLRNHFDQDANGTYFLLGIPNEKIIQDLVQHLTGKDQSKHTFRQDQWQIIGMRDGIHLIHSGDAHSAFREYVGQWLDAYLGHENDIYVQPYHNAGILTTNNLYMTGEEIHAYTQDATSTGTIPPLAGILLLRKQVRDLDAEEPTVEPI